VLIGWFGERLLTFSRRSQNRVSNLSALLTKVFSGIVWYKLLRQKSTPMTDLVRGGTVAK